MNAEQIKLARHALGLPNKKHTSNRNYFCTGPGSNDYDAWLALVASGDAVRRTTTHCGGDDLFYLTLKGALAVREPKEHLSREDTAAMRKLESE